MDFTFLTEPNTWIALLTLTFLEIVLGIDNIVFLSIVSSKLEKHEQPKARKIGLALALVFRIVLLLGLSWVLKLTKPLFHLDWSWLKAAVNGQSIIVFLGGMFLLYKSVSEIHHKLEGEEESLQNHGKKPSLVSAIIQIALLNLVFSFDSILTAIGLVSLAPPPMGFGEVHGLIIMILSVIISIIIMLAFAGPVSDFVNKHPTIQILGLSFLILIGVMLLAEASHSAEITIFNNHVNSIPKGYLYFAIFFSLFVEFLNLKMKKNSSTPVQLHNSKIVDDQLKDTDIND